MRYWDALLGFNVVKYPGVVRQFLVALGFDKEEVCFEGENRLDWQRVRVMLKANRARVLEMISLLNPRGSKPDIVKPYAKCERIDKNLEGL